MRWIERLELRLDEVGPHGFARRRSAACLLGLDGFTPGGPGFSAEPEVAVEYPRSGRVRAARLSNVGPLVVAHGLACTGVGRTLLDCATVAGLDVVERAVECAIRTGRLTDSALRTLAAAPVRGAPALRVVAARRPPGSAPTGSDAETVLLQRCRHAGLPTPERQVRHGRYSIDLAWPLFRVAVEVDGRPSHGTDDAFVNDRRRQNRIVVGGWLELRFSADDIDGEAVDTIAEALRMRGWDGRRLVVDR